MPHPQQRSPSHRGGRPPTGEDAHLKDLLTPGRKVNYFKGDSGADQRWTVRAELLDADAQSDAQSIKDLDASQLRRFYGSVVDLKRELEVDPDGATDELVRTRLALLKAHTAYAKKRLEGKMPDDFVRFIVRHVASVETKEDFLHGFAPCFEAVVAYHRYFKTKQRGD